MRKEDSPGFTLFRIISSSMQYKHRAHNYFFNFFSNSKSIVVVVSFSFLFHFLFLHITFNVQMLFLSSVPAYVELFTFPLTSNLSQNAYLRRKLVKDVGLHLSCWSAHTHTIFLLGNFGIFYFWKKFQFASNV